MSDELEQTTNQPLDLSGLDDEARREVEQAIAQARQRAANRAEESSPLMLEYKAALKKIGRGNVRAFTNLQVEFRKRGLRI